MRLQIEVPSDSNARHHQHLSTLADVILCRGWMAELAKRYA